MTFFLSQPLPPPKYEYTPIKKKIKFFSYIYKEIENGAVAKSYMANGLLLYGEILLKYDFQTTPL
jgi:hypothetical protein